MREKMQNFGAGQREPNQAICNNQCTEHAPYEQPGAIGVRPKLALACRILAGRLAEPAIPEMRQAVRNFAGGQKNYQSDAQDARANKILNERITHRAGL
jgi:hypothetical protein